MRENEERWKQLCAQAAHEQDPLKLQNLVQEINRLLEAKANRWSQTSPLGQGPK
jgi:hypothetical protein